MNKLRSNSIGSDSRRLSGIGVARAVFHLLPFMRMPTLSMVLVGIAASVAEMVGITFLISLIFLIAQEQPGGGSVYGWLPTYLEKTGIVVSHAAVVAILIAAIFSKLVLTFVDGMMVSSASHKISQYVQAKVYDQFLEIPYREIHQHDRGELITILASETYTIAQAHYSIVRIGVNFGTLLIFGIALIGTAWEIAIVALLASVLHTLTMKTFAKAYSRLGGEASTALESLTGWCWTTLQTLKAVRSFGLEDRQRSIFQTMSTGVRKLSHRSDQLGHITAMLSETIIFGVLLAVMVLSGKLGLAFPAVLASTVLIYRVQPHIRELDLQMLKLMEMETPVRRIVTLIDAGANRETYKGDVAISDLRQGIEFRDVDYIYPGANKAAISNRSFFLPAGRKIGIIGPSGSGKTTIMNLILGITSPSAGSVLVDGIPLDTVRRKDWTSLLAVAGQDVELMEGTVAENIKFFRDLPDEAMIEAAEIAGASEFVAELEWGYDDWVGDEALKLSGGQRQRIGIARALIGRQKILLLDEATSALDEETEAAILARLLETYKDRTVVIITHRKSVIPFLDEVIDLKQLDNQYKQESQTT